MVPQIIDFMKGLAVGLLVFVLFVSLDVILHS